MDHKSVIHGLIKIAAFELLQFIKNSESAHPNRWVPAAEIKSKLDINFVAVPRGGTQYGEKGWLFGILARMLEDESKIEHKKVGSRAFYRSKTS